MIKLIIKCSDGTTIEAQVSEINDIKVAVPSNKDLFVPLGSTEPREAIYVAETLFGYIAEHDLQGQIVLYTDIMDPDETPECDCDEEDCDCDEEEYEEEEDFGEDGESLGVQVVPSENLVAGPVFGIIGGTDEKRTGVRPSRAISDRRGSTPRLPAQDV